MPIPNMNLLELFITVVEAGTLSEAARRLQLPKSSVSRGISRLEETVGSRLLHRTPRKLALSPAGAALYEQLKPQMQALQEMFASIERDGQPSGELRITAPVDFASLMSRLLCRFIERYPALRVELVLTDDVVDLISERIDVALRVRLHQLAPAGLHGRPIGPLPLGLYASPGYAARRALPALPEELREHDWVGFRGPRGGRELSLRRDTHAVNLTLESKISSNNFHFLRELLLRDAGIGVMVELFAQPDVAAGRLVPVLPGWRLPDGQLWLVWPSRPQAAAKVAAFRDFVLEELHTSFPHQEATARGR